MSVRVSLGFLKLKNVKVGKFWFLGNHFESLKLKKVFFEKQEFDILKMSNLKI